MDGGHMQERPTITATQHGGYIIVTAALSVVCMLLFLGIRLVVRRPWVQLFGLDDWAILFASASGLCQSALLLASTNAGLGRVESELSPKQSSRALKLLYASDLLYIPTLFVAQFSVTRFFLRLSGPNRSFFHRMARCIGIVAAVFALTCFLLVAVRVEDGLQPWEAVVVGHKSTLDRWLATGALSLVVEILLMICPAWLFWMLQMPLRKKLGCSVYFGLRFPTILLTVFRLISLIKASKGTDRTFDMTLPSVLSQLEMHFTVLAATIPIIRNPLTKLNSGFLNTTLEQMDPAASAAYASSKSGGSGKGQSYELSNLTASKQRESRMLEQRVGQGTEAMAEGGSDSVEERQSILSEGSDKIIIKRTVMVDYS